MIEENGGALTVGELTRRVKTLLEDAFPELWVRGEISNLKIQSSGHAYFTLKDATAAISAVMFRGDVTRAGLALKDGMKISAFGRVTVYEPRGAYQLVVRAAIDDGEGRLRREFEALKARLAAEGLFEPARKRPLPVPARSVAVITSPTGAALRDFVSVLQRRGWRGRLVVFPARVQGAGAAAEIAAQLKKAGDSGLFDLVVVARGGGSLEDLWAFNEEPVARAVAACPLPVISAVGHETDFTLSDFAADVRAETPTAAAELISSAYLRVSDRLDVAEEALHAAVTDFMENREQALDLIEAHLRAQSPTARLERDAGRLARAESGLAAASAVMMDRLRRRVDTAGHRHAGTSPAHRFALFAQRIDGLDTRLARATENRTAGTTVRLAGLEARLRAAGIDSTLRRGFALVKDDKGRVISHAGDVKDGRRLLLRFADGEADATGGRSLF
jgi:exodeoxyribonuclease VII large subunit